MPDGVGVPDGDAHSPPTDMSTPHIAVLDGDAKTDDVSVAVDVGVDVIVDDDVNVAESDAESDAEGDGDDDS